MFNLLIQKVVFIKKCIKISCRFFFPFKEREIVFLQIPSSRLFCIHFSNFFLMFEKIQFLGKSKVTNHTLVRRLSIWQIRSSTKSNLSDAKWMWSKEEILQLSYHCNVGLGSAVNWHSKMILLKSGLCLMRGLPKNVGLPSSSSSSSAITEQWKIISIQKEKQRTLK